MTWFKNVFNVWFEEISIIDCPGLCYTCDLDVKRGESVVEWIYNYRSEHWWYLDIQGYIKEPEYLDLLVITIMNNMRVGHWIVKDV